MSAAVPSPALALRRAAVLAVAVGLASPSQAAADTPPGTAVVAPDRAPCRVFEGGRVHLPEGPREGVTVVVDGARIAAVGEAIPGLSPPDRGAGTVTFRGRACGWEDARGRELTPGLVDAAAPLGLVEVAMEGDTDDTDPGGDPVRASFRVWDAYDPRSTPVPVARAAGLTGALVAPSGGLVSGQSAWVSLGGATQEAAVVKGPAAVHASLAALPSRAEAIGRLRELLEDARAFDRDRAAWSRNQSRPFAAERLDLEALVRVVRGEIPLVVAADGAADVEAAVRLAREQGVRLVVAGGAEAWLVADLLREAGVPVIVDPLRYGPGSFDQLRARRDNAAFLHRAGVAVAISTFSGYNARTLPHVAGNAVREGLPHAAALAAVTEVPARVFGVPDRGRIAPGAVADLVLWSGDPFELDTAVLRVLVGGREVSTRSRQTALLEAYREVPGAAAPREAGATSP